ncbi:unnamed protein product [Anisakis simplex]|uniref:Autophagy-related protein 2 n=1 Tax=Anisakis simplex TaxID=6269 RepID=A0A0M3J296_ANISI|nr:unnamed protein product [Anisakis simplex]
MPVDEYRKNDGHIVKGLQKGAESFGISTAAAAVDIAQQVVGLVQGVAELAFDIVTPDYPAYANRRRFANAISRRPPNDLREGFHMAYETVREGVTDTAQVLQLAAQEDRAEGYWPLRGLLRQVTPSILRPFVVASKATGHVLGGIKSQLKPDSHRCVIIIIIVIVIIIIIVIIIVVIIIIIIITITIVVVVIITVII